MKIKLSKSQWQQIGKTTGWLKKAEDEKYTEIDAQIDFMDQLHEKYLLYTKKLQEKSTQLQPLTFEQFKNKEYEYIYEYGGDEWDPNDVSYYIN